MVKVRKHSVNATPGFGKQFNFANQHYNWNIAANLGVVVNLDQNMDSTKSIYHKKKLYQNEGLLGKTGLRKTAAIPAVWKLSLKKCRYRSL